MPTAQFSLRAVSPWRNGALSPYPASANTQAKRTPAAMTRSISARAISGFVRAVRYSVGTPARSNRARLLVQLSGRNNRNASMTGTSPRASVSDTSVWQLAVLPSAEAYCAATPTECVPFLGSLGHPEKTDRRLSGRVSSCALILPRHGGDPVPPAPGGAYQ